MFLQGHQHPGCPSIWVRRTLITSDLLLSHCLLPLLETAAVIDARALWGWSVDGWVGLERVGG